MNTVISIHYSATCFVTECGQLFVETKLSNVNEERPKYGSAPWNVGIYKKNTKTNEYEIMCGGSLISSKLVISGEFSVGTYYNILSEELNTIVFF